MKTNDYLALPVSLCIFWSIFQLSLPSQAEYVEMCGTVESFSNFEKDDSKETRRYMIHIYYEEQDRYDYVQVKRKDYLTYKKGSQYCVKEKVSSGWMFLDTFAVILLIAGGIMTLIYLMNRFDGA